MFKDPADAISSDSQRSNPTDIWDSATCSDVYRRLLSEQFALTPSALSLKDPRGLGFKSEVILTSGRVKAHLHPVL